MTWSDEVCANRIAVARAHGARGSSALAPRTLLPTASARQPNSGAGSIVLVAGLVAASLYASKEGHKLRGRKLPPLLDRLRRLLSGGGRTTGSAARRPASGGAAPRQPPPQQAAAAAEWRQQPARALAGAAEVQRQQSQQQVRQQVRF